MNHNTKNGNKKPQLSQIQTPKTLSFFKRFKPSRAQLLSGALIFSASILAYGLAGPVLTVFTSGTTISSAAVNDNFSFLNARIAALEAKLASVSNVTVNGQPTVRFSGVNVQVVNGSGLTATANGTGNLIIGYDEADQSGINRCSLGMTVGGIQLTAANCVANGGTLSTTGFKSGSHYLVTGDQNNYSSFGGLLAGYRNTANTSYASVSGGMGNTASGLEASVSGGYGNTASGMYSSMSGGGSGTASGMYSSVSGGWSNIASGPAASVSGGNLNTASSSNASVSGGQNNFASGLYSSVSGGGSGTAIGMYSSVSGGLGCTTSSTYKWTVGQISGGCSAIGN